MSAGGAAGGGVAVEVGLALAGADLKTACVICLLADCVGTALRG